MVRKGNRGTVLGGTKQLPVNTSGLLHILCSDTKWIFFATALHSSPVRHLVLSADIVWLSLEPYFPPIQNGSLSPIIPPSMWSSSTLGSLSLALCLPIQNDPLDIFCSCRYKMALFAILFPLYVALLDARFFPQYKMALFGTLLSPHDPPGTSYLSVALSSARPGSAVGVIRVMGARWRWRA